MTPKNSSRRRGLDKDSLGKNSKEDLIPPRRGDQKLSASRTDSLPREPTKRTPVGTKCIKVQNNTGKAFYGTVGNQQSVSVSKNPVPRNSCNIITSACSLKPLSSSLCSAGSMKKSTPDAKSSAKLATRSRTTLSNSSVKSPLNALKRTSELKTTGLSSCEPSVRTPQKILRNKNGSRKTALSSCSSSISRLSSSRSSISSLDSLPSESSTHSTEAKLSNSECQIINFPSSRCGGVSLESAVPQPLDMQLLPRKQSYVKHEKSGTQLRRCTDEASRSTRVPSQPACVDSRSCNNKDSGEQFKPSRLRMPTPKFGFFDTGSSNNISRHPENYVQNSSPNSLSGINQHIETGRCKVSELQPTETLAKSVTVTEMRPMSPAVVHQPRMTSLELFDGNDLYSSDTANCGLFSDVSVAVFDNPNRHNSGISFNNEEYVISSKTSCSPLSVVMDSDSEQQLPCILQNSGHTQRVLSPGAKSYNKENLFPCENQTGDMHEHVEDPMTHKMMIDKLSHLSLCDADNLSKLGKLKLASPTEHLFVCDHKVDFQKGKDSNMNTQINGASGINVMQENIIGMIIEEEILSGWQESK
ncbi:hypothetical protein QJS10_CPB20g00356 [Acorus calamus]|uniref:Uncharacterized protein n=1 Tax=Acorus calamus TaxID=4465 RepID=A0AAV9C8X9_ACOCL|nr:hypothetical protein QJS10_CPB20g00356 [Acorus calamus]